VNDRERDTVINDYLRRLSRALGDAPGEARRELLEDVRGHIDEAWASAPTRDRATLLNILARLGEPEALAREERERLGLVTPPEGGPGLLEVAAIVLTVLFWPIGLLLAWLSPHWRALDKTLATAVAVLGLLLIVGTSFVALAAVSGQAPVMVQPVATAPVGAPPSAPAPVTPQENVAQAVAARGLALYGLFGAPLTAAAYLALRLRPRPHRAALLLPVAVLAGVLVAILVLFLLPAPGAPSAHATAVNAPIQVQQGGGDGR